MASLEHRLKGSLEGTFKGFPIYLLCVLWFYFLCISFMFYGSIEAITEAVYKWFYFRVLPVYNYSTCYTNRVFTRSIHQVHVYAFGVPTTIYVFGAPTTL